MPRLRLLAGFALAALAGCDPASVPTPPLPPLMDVSADDCVASALVYDRPPSAWTHDDPGTPFVNDVCDGDFIRLGIDGEERELTRAENVPLGTGGPYTDGTYEVTVARRAVAKRTFLGEGEETECRDPGVKMYHLRWDVEVRIRARSGGAWTIDGTLTEWECVPE